MKGRCLNGIYKKGTQIAMKGDVMEVIDDILINRTTGIKVSGWKDLCTNFMTKQVIQPMEGEEQESEKPDNVNHPKHYTSHPSGIECIEITRHYCFAIGNAIKYLWRAGLKVEEGLTNKQKEIEDLEKAKWYINDRINQLKNETEQWKI